MVTALSFSRCIIPALNITFILPKLLSVNFTACFCFSICVLFWCSMCFEGMYCENCKVEIARISVRLRGRGSHRKGETSKKRGNVFVFFDVETTSHNVPSPLHWPGGRISLSHTQKKVGETIEKGSTRFDSREYKKRGRAYTEKTPGPLLKEKELSEIIHLSI